MHGVWGIEKQSFSVPTLLEFRLFPDQNHNFPDPKCNFPGYYSSHILKTHSWKWKYWRICLLTKSMCKNSYCTNICTFAGHFPYLCAIFHKFHTFSSISVWKNFLKLSQMEGLQVFRSQKLQCHGHCGWFSSKCITSIITFRKTITFSRGPLLEHGALPTKPST